MTENAVFSRAPELYTRQCKLLHIYNFLQIFYYVTSTRLISIILHFFIFPGFQENNFWYFMLYEYFLAVEIIHVRTHCDNKMIDL